MSNSNRIMPERLPRTPVTCTRSGRPRRPWRGAAAAVAVLLAAGVAVWSSLREPRTDTRHDAAGPAADEGRRAGASRTADGAAVAGTEPWMAPAARRLPPTGRVHGRREPAQAVSGALPGVARGFTPVPPAAPQAPEREPEELPLFTALRASRGQPVPPEVAALAQQITQGATNEAQRARALYDWITANIRYDVQEWAHITGGGSSYMNAHDPLSVLARGTTVCAGYAWLFDALAQSVGLGSTFLIGAVRGYRGTPDDTLVSAFKHAWNAVQVDGDWRLLDATWGARQTGESETDYLDRQAYYFDTPPGQMIFDHLPETPEWQLLADPLPDTAAFNHLPNLKPTFFQHGLRLGDAFTSTLVADAARGGMLTVISPATVDVAATLAPLDGRAASAPVPVRISGTLREIAIDRLAPGAHLLRIYSRQSGDERFACSADFVIRAE